MARQPEQRDSTTFVAAPIIPSDRAEPKALVPLDAPRSLSPRGITLLNKLVSSVRHSVRTYTLFNSLMPI